MKHWVITTILLAIIMLAGWGCMENLGYMDSKAREQSIHNYNEIYENREKIKELRKSHTTTDEKADQSMGIFLVPVPVWPPAEMPGVRLPPRKIIREQDKWVLHWPPQPWPKPGQPIPKPLPC